MFYEDCVLCRLRRYDGWTDRLVEARAVHCVRTGMVRDYVTTIDRERKNGRGSLLVDVT